MTSGRGATGSLSFKKDTVQRRESLLRDGIRLCEATGERLSVRARHGVEQGYRALAIGAVDEAFDARAPDCGRDSVLAETVHQGIAHVGVDDRQMRAVRSEIADGGARVGLAEICNERASAVFLGELRGGHRHRQTPRACDESYEQQTQRS